MTSTCCRLCLLGGPNLQPVQDLTIASNEPDSSDLPQLIVRYLSIEPQSYSPNPVYICSECCNTIAKWHWFRESCLQNNAVYQNMVLQEPEKDDDPQVNEFLNVEIKQEIKQEIEIDDVGYNEDLYAEPLEPQVVVEKKPRKLQGPRKPRTKKNLPDNTIGKDKEEEEGKEPPVQKKRGRPKLPPKKKGRPRLPESERNRGPKMCPLCGKMVMAMDGHIRMHNQDRRYQCQYCPQNFYSLSSYKNHVNVHTKEVKYTCPIPECGKFFWRRETLKMHMNKHSDEPTFKCPYCPKAYRMRSGLVSHRKTHNGPPDVQCFGCEKKFYTLSLMKSHARMHAEVKPYICTICDRGFTRKYYLSGHMEKDHPGVAWPAEVGDGDDAE